MPLRVPYRSFLGLPTKVDEALRRCFLEIEQRYADGMTLRVPYRSFRGLPTKEDQKLARNFLEIEQAFVTIPAITGDYTSDTFDRAVTVGGIAESDAALGGTPQYWAEDRGDYQIAVASFASHNVLQKFGSLSAGGTYEQMTVGVAHTDQKVSFKIDRNPTVNVSGMGVVARYEDRLNYYFAYVYRNLTGTLFFALGKYVAGAETTLYISSAVAPTAGDTVTLTINGSAIDLSVNGASQYSGTDTSLTAGVRAGVWEVLGPAGGGSGTKIYDFVAEAP